MYMMRTAPGERDRVRRWRRLLTPPLYRDGDANFCYIISHYIISSHVISRPGHCPPSPRISTSSAIVTSFSSSPSLCDIPPSPSDVPPSSSRGPLPPPSLIPSRSSQIKIGLFLLLYLFFNIHIFYFIHVTYGIQFDQKHMLPIHIL